MQVPTARPQREGGLSYKWIVAIVVVFGIFMSILDTTIVNIAIPRLQTAFGADLNSVQWVLTGYVLIQGVVTPLTGYFADRFGLKPVYIGALAAFTLGSALCGFAWSLPALIVFRLLQGAGGAFLLPLSITLLYSEFPPNERGTALGVLGIPILLAPALGPTLGGYIVTFADWPLIFYVNLPIGILGIILGVILLRDREPQGGATFDLPGFLLAGAGLALTLYGLSDASTDGWGSTKVLGSLVGGLLLLCLFVLVEVITIRRGRQPLMDLRVFLNGPFFTSNIANVLVTFALYGGLFLVPIYLENLRGQSAFQAGLILLPQALASMVAVIVGGRLVDRIGVKPVVIGGLLILAFAGWQLTYVTLQTPFAWFQVLLVLRGFSLGLSAQPLIVSALSEIRPRLLAQATAVNTVLRFVSSSLSVAILATLVQSQTKIHTGHLSELVTPASPLGQLLPRLQALFVSRGADITQARGAAIQEISLLIKRQAYMLAMQDAFWLSLILTVAAVIVVFFVRARRPGSAAPTPETPEAHEEAKARDEAMLAV